METNLEIPTTKSPREYLNAELHVYYGPSQKMLLYDFSVDICSGGLFLKTETPFSVNEELILSFILPVENKIVTCRAKVSWVNLKDEPRKPERPTGIGLQFIDLAPEYLEIIQSFIKHN